MVAGSFRSTLLAGSALALLVSVPPAVAQDTAGAAPGTLLERLTVKSGESAKGVADTPLATETTGEELTEAQITSIDDLGRALEPGVSFNSANGSVNIRGLDGPRVLTTIDGIQIPYLQDGAREASGGINSFDFNTLDAINIVRGGDSSRGGSGALGGAMVLSTMEPEDLLEEGRDTGGYVKTIFDSKDMSIGGFAGVAARMNGTSVLFQGGYRIGHETESQGDVGGYGPTRTEANPADYDENNLLFKIRQATESGHTFGLTAERYDIDTDTDLMSEQTPAGNYRPGNWWEMEGIRRERISFDYDYEAMGDDSFFDSANAVLYWQRLGRSSGNDGYRHTSVIGNYSRLSEVTNDSYGLSGLGEKTLELGGLSHKITLGGNFATGKTSQYSSGVDTCGPGPFPPFNACNFLHTNQSDMPDVDSTQLGIYIDDEISFGDSGFSLTPGVRFDWYDHSPKDTASYRSNPNFTGMPAGQSESQFSPKLLGKYEVTPELDVFAQWSMAFRAPTASELYLDYGAPGTYLRIGNPDMKPESSNGFEIGAAYDNGSLRGRATAFYNRYKNFIDTRGLSAAEQAGLGIAPGTYPFGVTQSINRANVEIYGAELSLEKQFDSGFSLNGALAYARGVDRDTGQVLGSVAPFKAVLGAGYATETWGANVNWIGVASVSDNSTANYKAKSYGLVDATAWWKPEQLKGFSVQAGVYNIFDETYYDSVSLRDVTMAQPEAYYSEPGRTFKVSITQRF
ncbi:MAG: TonB-dependent hemoglobin/transferrin/lactoferrin family receptor [Hoeflea sp.]|uniref:TonB-dependent hemoglobin/transferrin/lactoferrin family receptor n=1 Tax=Hoeflea sp. TaxID=1940281 RepID=UPI001DCF4AE8|nr:TonB-dependent hemoglobin/transferrin/lactoferrin family receptor [Hoeflea sp.]MBU4527298.1 TonB-dependent hemoglobin/transferrin/lactoferrin family receptor [Alphaproteobacteria bacterium]MBU4546919.1 TonB-dependent hemoglobin/transferrin/lactoferrin family receptor [Alphaproteobacteria bacterium]MBU4551569.1 TonB-dependent hemoglobin/transferrin/lactoferrin family receptor [Alphaproteobacteria bacterium]MBV1725574.1 TonB-dependent hemoglobin/transferrin/lactoferrin family receptor [Hoeflea